MTIETMEDLFLSEIMDLYDAEQRLVKALPKMVDAVTSPQLRQAIEQHLEQTRGHVNRLEQIFDSMGEEAKGITCDAMKGLIEEADDVASDIEASPLRDAGIIAAANRVEHYEIAAYGSARTFAQSLGLDNAATLLEETLREEKQADETLTNLATSRINLEATKVTAPR